MSFDKSNIILLIVGCSSGALPSAFKVSDSESDFSELVEISVTLGYKVLDLLPTIALYYGIFWLIIVTILIDFSGY